MPFPHSVGHDGGTKMTLTGVARFQVVRNVVFEVTEAHTFRQVEIAPTGMSKQKEGAAHCRIEFPSFGGWNGARHVGEKMEKYVMTKSRGRYVRLFRDW